MNAVKWLKENNEYYKDIELNDLWDDEWKQSELSTLMVTERRQREVPNECEQTENGPEIEVLILMMEISMMIVKIVIHLMRRNCKKIRLQQIEVQKYVGIHIQQHYR